MVSTPIKTLLGGKGFSCEAGGNWTRRKAQELDVWHLEHVTYTPAPPGPKRQGTEPSVHTWISEGGGRIVGLKLTVIGLHCCLCSRERRGETVTWVAVHGGKGGHMIRVSRGDGGDCVAEEQNDLQEGFFFNRQGTFLVARALRLERSEGRRRARSKEERA